VSSPGFATSILDQAGQALGGFLPRLGGALVLLVVGLLVARLFGWAARRTLTAVGIDRLSERLGVQPVLERAGLGTSLARLLGRIVRVVVSIVVVFAALSLLGLQFLSQSLNQAVLALPELLIAAALVLAGVVAGGWAGERVERVTYQMDLPLPLGRLTQIVVVAVFVITAAAEIAVPTIVVMVPLAVGLATIGATFAIAFGLGGRDVARAVSAGRYVRSAYEPGQTITVGDVTGTVRTIEGAATVLDARDGRTVRIPNYLLLDSVVTVTRSSERFSPDE
jgi:small-conductance mechanosensitive channel